MELMRSERIPYIDTAKGIGIVLVCVGHACTNMDTIADSPFADIVRFVTLFHMALFFFVNGMLYNEKYSQRPVVGIFKKVKAYYIPFIKYNLLFWLLHNVFAYCHVISGQLDAKDYAYVGLRAYAISFIKTVLGFRQTLAGAMWFLEALIIISFCFIILDYVVNCVFPKKRMLFLSIGVIAIVLFNRLFNLSELPLVPDSLSKMIYWGLNGLAFFYMGYLFRVYNWNEKLKKYKYWVALALLLGVLMTVITMRPRIVSVITNVSAPVWKYGVKALTGGRGVSGMPLVQYIVFALVCLAGILMTLLFAQWKGIRDSKILRLFGKYSLHIMCLHFLAFKAVSILIIAVEHLPIERLAEGPVLKRINGFWWVAYALVGCVLPIIFVKGCEKAAAGLRFFYNKHRDKI